MSLSDLASLGNFFSGVAVVVTLIFLLLQMRQSDRNQRALMQQGRSSRAAGILSWVMHPHVAQITVRARAGKELEAWEVEIFVRYFGAWFMNYEDSFLQHRLGTLDETSWAADLLQLQSILSEPATRVAWKFLRPLLGGAFGTFVDGLIADTPTIAWSDNAESWKNWIRQERKGLPAN